MPLSNPMYTYLMSNWRFSKPHASNETTEAWKLPNRFDKCNERRSTLNCRVKDHNKDNCIVKFIAARSIIEVADFNVIRLYKFETDYDCYACLFLGFRYLLLWQQNSTSRLINCLDINRVLPDFLRHVLFYLSVSCTSNVNSPGWTLTVAKCVLVL